MRSTILLTIAIVTCATLIFVSGIYVGFSRNDKEVKHLKKKIESSNYDKEELQHQLDMCSDAYRLQKMTSEELAKNLNNDNLADSLMYKIENLWWYYYK